VSTTRSAAITIGVLFIIATVSAILGLYFLGFHERHPPHVGGRGMAVT
jgi:hypothetical protein